MTVSFCTDEIEPSLTHAVVDAVAMGEDAEEGGEGEVAEEEEADIEGLTGKSDVSTFFFLKSRGRTPNVSVDVGSG